MILLRDVLLDIVRCHISKEFFLGGSRRFGWDRGDSDFDVFLPPEAHGPLTDLHLPIAMQASYYVRGFTHYEAIVLNAPVDLIVAGSLDRYTQLRDEHDRIEEYLRAHRGIVVSARAGGLHGKEFYRMILSMLDMKTI